MIMKKLFKTFKTKTSDVLKNAYSNYSNNFMKIYGPSIKAGMNPFM